MHFVGSTTPFSILLSGTKPPNGTEAQCEGKRKLLSSSISLVILGEQFSTELVSRIRNTFSYNEREWHNWALWCDLNSQINIWMALALHLALIFCPSCLGRYNTSREGILSHYCLLMVEKAFMGLDLRSFCSLNVGNWEQGRWGGGNPSPEFELPFQQEAEAASGLYLILISTALTQTLDPISAFRLVFF